MSVVSAVDCWLDALTDLEARLGEGELLVQQGRLEEFRVPPVPVVTAGLPVELTDRALDVQRRVADLTERVVEEMAATRRELEVAAQQRTDRSERGDRVVGRQWQPAYVDARA